MSKSYPLTSALCVVLVGFVTTSVFAGGGPQELKPDSAKGFQIEAGAVTTLIDGLDAGTGGLAIDRSGNLYSADFGWNLSGPGKGGDKIFKVTPSGKATLFCRQQRGASGNTMDAQGNLFQSSIGGGFISKITPDATVTEYARKGLVNPVGIALGDEGELFVCNCGNNTIQRIGRDGTSSVFCKSFRLNTPNGIARDKDGTLYVCNFGNGDVIKITAKGIASRLATLPGGNNGHLILHEGVLFVIARSDHRVYKVGLDGRATYFVGSGVRGDVLGKTKPFEMRDLS